MDTLDSQGQYIQALDYAEQLSQLLSKASSPAKSRDLTVSRIQLASKQANELVERGKAKSALKLLARAQQVLKASTVAEKKTVCGLRSLLLNTVAHAYKTLGQNTLAYRALEKAAKILKKHGCAENLGLTLINLCAVLDLMMLHKQAFACAKEATTLLKLEVGDMRASKAKTAVLRAKEALLGYAYINMGIQARLLEQEEKEYFQRARELIEENPEATGEMRAALDSVGGGGKAETGLGDRASKTLPSFGVGHKMLWAADAVPFARALKKSSSNKLTNDNAKRLRMCMRTRMAKVDAAKTLSSSSSSSSASLYSLRGDRSMTKLQENPPILQAFLTQSHATRHVQVHAQTQRSALVKASQKNLATSLPEGKLSSSSSSSSVTIPKRLISQPTGDKCKRTLVTLRRKTSQKYARQKPARPLPAKVPITTESGTVAPIDRPILPREAADPEKEEIEQLRTAGALEWKDPQAESGEKPCCCCYCCAEKSPDIVLPEKGPESAGDKAQFVVYAEADHNQDEKCTAEVGNGQGGDVARDCGEFTQAVASFGGKEAGEPRPEVKAEGEKVDADEGKGKGTNDSNCKSQKETEKVARVLYSGVRKLPVAGTNHTTYVRLKFVRDSGRIRVAAQDCSTKKNCTANFELQEADASDLEKVVSRVRTRFFTP